MLHCTGLPAEQAALRTYNFSVRGSASMSAPECDDSLARWLGGLALFVALIVVVVLVWSRRGNCECCCCRPMGGKVVES